MLGFIKNLFSTEARKPEPSKSDKAFAMADAVVRAYTNVLASRKDAFISDIELPYSKDAIKGALKLDALKMRDKQYTEIAGGCFISLSSFRPANELADWLKFDKDTAALTDGTADIDDRIKALASYNINEFLQNSQHEMDQLLAEWDKFKLEHSLA